jgi:hypothetical protein
MTAKIVGRPKRTRPTDRVNYKLDTEIRKILTNLAARNGRNESAQVEQSILQTEAIDRILSRGDDLNQQNLEKELREIRNEITETSEGDD